MDSDRQRNVPRRVLFGEFFHLVAGDFRGEAEVAVFNDDFLSGLRSYELEELGLEGVHRLTGLFVDVNVEEPSERVFAAQTVFECRFKCFGVAAFQRDCPHARGCITDS